MAPLNRRIEGLERAMLPNGDPLFIFVRFVRPGRLDEQAARAEFGGAVILREKGESEDAFEARVQKEAQRINPGRPVTLIEVWPGDLAL